MTEQVHDDVAVWTGPFGPLEHDGAGKVASILYGFDTRDRAAGARVARIPDLGASFGFVERGEVRVVDDYVDWTIRGHQWFRLRGGLEATISPGSCLFVAQREDHRGLHVMGGPIEPSGRLRNLGGTSDTILVAPTVLGDPCLNHVHYPAGDGPPVHRHPSTRFAMVAHGQGRLERPGRDPVRLEAGMVLRITAGVEHRLVADPSRPMDVVTYHPDSDWGPTHDVHPVRNRTWDDERGARMGAEPPDA